MKNVVLLSTRRLPPAYFDTVREDLGDPDITLDVVGWVAPAGPVEDKVHSFTLIGPGRMPVAPPPEPEPVADPTEVAPDAVIAPEAVAEPEAVVGDAEVAPAAAEVAADAAGEASATSAAAAEEVGQPGITSTAEVGDGSGSAAGVGDGSASAAGVGVGSGSAAGVGVGSGSAGGVGVGSASVGGVGDGSASGPAAAVKPRPTGVKRVVKAVQWRARRGKKVVGRMLPTAIKTSGPVKFLRGNRASKDLGKTYWGRVLSRRDVMTTIEKADVVVALDAGAIWAGWNLGQRRASTPVVLGIPAARRELDMLKAPAGNG